TQAARAEAAYYPTLFAMASGGATREAHVSPGGTFTTQGPGVNPQLQLTWILLDFGRRRAGVERGGQELLRANFTFNRKLQEVAFAVSRTYFGLDASRARVSATSASFESAAAVEEAVDARLQRGLATQPDILLARQERARAAFEVQEALGAVNDAQAPSPRALESRRPRSCAWPISRPCRFPAISRNRWRKSSTVRSLAGQTWPRGWRPCGPGRLTSGARERSSGRVYSSRARLARRCSGIVWANPPGRSPRTRPSTARFSTSSGGCSTASSARTRCARRPPGAAWPRPTWPRSS